MKELVYTTQFRRDLKQVRKQNVKLDKLDLVLDLLQNSKDLPVSYRPHRLKGTYYPFWECHVLPDLLLVYDIKESEIVLIRLGSHSELFK